MLLPQPEHIVVTAGNIADLQWDMEVHGGVLLSLRNKSIGDAALVENFKTSCMQPAGARTDDIRAEPPLHDGHIDVCQRQFARQHHSSRTRSDDHHCMLAHRHLRVARPWHGRAMLGQTGA